MSKKGIQGMHKMPQHPMSRLNIPTKLDAKVETG